MRILAILVIIPLFFFSMTASGADGHCITRIKQSSVDFPTGSVRTMNCRYFHHLTDIEFENEKNKCQARSRKNRAKEWQPGTCPKNRLISTCTFDRYGPARVERASIIHVYEEIGGNLSLENELRLARQQCNTMTGSSGQFTIVRSTSNNNDVVSKSSSEATVNSQSNSTTTSGLAAC